MAIQFELDQEYGLCIIASTLVAFECLIIGFAVPGRIRGQVFSEDFMRNNFGNIHQQETQEQISKQGYPDMGSGRYSKKLSYMDWLLFNKAQRVHYNMLEVLAPIIGFVLLGGLQYPVAASIFGFMFFIARIAFIWYLTDEGAQHPMRMFGAILSDVALLGGFIVSIMAGIKIYKQ